MALLQHAAAAARSLVALLVAARTGTRMHHGGPALICAWCRAPSHRLVTWRPGVEVCAGCKRAELEWAED